MIKKRIESELAWMKLKISGARIDCYYGFRNEINNHGHTVLSGSEVIYDRSISGANLVVFKTGFEVSGANLFYPFKLMI